MSFSTAGHVHLLLRAPPDMVGTVQVTDDTQDSQKQITKAGNSQTGEMGVGGRGGQGEAPDDQAEADARTPTARPPTPCRWA